MGLKLIHSNENQEAKPRVFVVAEQSIFEMICQDLALDVYPVCFDYASFMQASLTKSISFNNAVVLVSDSLSQSTVPLEALLAVTKDNTILIPWQMAEEDVLRLNVALASRRPTLNTLRRSIFNHIGLNEPPARFDGDTNIDAPRDAAVVEFAANEEQNAKLRFSKLQSKVHASNNFEALRSRDNHPVGQALKEQSVPQPIVESFVQPQVEVQSEAVVEAEIVAEEVVIPKVEKPIEKPTIKEPFIGADPKSIYEARSEHDEAFSAFFETPRHDEGGIESIFDSSAPVFNTLIQPIAEKPIFDTPLFTKPSETVAKTEAEQNFEQETVPDFRVEAKPEIQEPVEVKNEIVQKEVKETYPTSEFSLPDVPSFNSQSVFENPIEQPETPSTNETFGSIFDSRPTPQTPEAQPMFAFGGHDANGNQNMWSMYESKDDLSDAKSLTMNDFPDVVDDKKQISLKEPLVICVYSPKGGVGKTSISVNMAARLAYTTRAQVCIVDLDIGFGNVGTRLGLYNPTVRELLSENHLDSEAIARNLVYDRRSGLFALLAPLRPETGTNRRKFSPATYNKILGLLTQRFDIIILDCPVELRDPLVSGFALTSADKVVMVVNNEQATLLDARRALEAMCRSKESQRLPGLGINPKSIGLIVNQKVDNVGREIEDVIQVISGADQDHPSRQVDVLAVIADDRELWVGNANMARTVATSGENAVDTQLDEVWAKLLPENIMKDISGSDDDGAVPSNANQLDEILSNKNTQGASKAKRRFSIRKDKGAS